ncbi:PqqD family protein [Streptomyces sp. AC512_CC834]|uniref:PqqD family protein n=1 Tax=Streptomyces sp. AC512_CC834 TaxID=2823691 RepID=UPI001C2669EE|nr:PqqD family protein [Streptomyces sp. AC512_CC834]
MRVLPGSDVAATVLENGELLLRKSGGATYTFAPPAAALWIALRQHDGDPVEAANALGDLWDAECVLIRAELEMWIDELRAAELVRVEV